MSFQAFPVGLRSYTLKIFLFSLIFPGRLLALVNPLTMDRSCCRFEGGNMDLVGCFIRVYFDS